MCKLLFIIFLLAAEGNSAVEYKYLELLGFCSVYQNQEICPAYLCNYYEMRAVCINNTGKYLKYILATIFYYFL